jgi:hypothetical protein
MLYILDANQRQQLITLAKSQVASINQYGYDRFVLMDAFRRNLTGNIPAGSTGLNRVAGKTPSNPWFEGSARKETVELADAGARSRSILRTDCQGFAAFRGEVPRQVGARFVRSATAGRGAAFQVPCEP